MFDLYRHIEKMTLEKGFRNVTEMCKASGASRGSLTDLKMGRKKTLSTDTVQKIADCFGVTVDAVLGNGQKETPAFTGKDERDIAKRLEAVLGDLEQGQDGISFLGEALDESTRELLAKSIQNSLEMGKALAKQKYTPKKYKKE